MKTFNRLMIAMSLLALPALLPAQECQGVMVNTKAVALSAPRSGSLVNFTGSGGQLDPVPLLETTFNVVGVGVGIKPTCVIVTFSAQADPGDNYGVYQVSIDNVPMFGHGQMTEYPISTPVVFDATTQGSFFPVEPYRFPNSSNSRMLSYKFFAQVAPGTHVIRVKVAGCCSNLPGGNSPVFVRAATVVANW